MKPALAFTITLKVSDKTNLKKLETIYSPDYDDVIELVDEAVTQLQSELRAKLPYYSFSIHIKENL